MVVRRAWLRSATARKPSLGSFVGHPLLRYGDSRLVAGGQHRTGEMVNRIQHPRVGEDQVVVVLVPAGIQARQHAAGDLPGSGTGANPRPPAQVIQIRLYQLGE